MKKLFDKFIFVVLALKQNLKRNLFKKMVHCGKYLSVVVGQHQKDQVTKKLPFQIDSKNFSFFFISCLYVYKLNKRLLTC